MVIYLYTRNYACVMGRPSFMKKSEDDKGDDTTESREEEEEIGQIVRGDSLGHNFDLFIHSALYSYRSWRGGGMKAAVFPCLGPERAGGAKDDQSTSRYKPFFMPISACRLHRPPSKTLSRLVLDKVSGRIT